MPAGPRRAAGYACAADSSIVRTIVSGEFTTENAAARAVDRLLRACLRGEQIRAFFLKRGARPRRLPARRMGLRPPFDRARANRPPTLVEVDFRPAAGGEGLEVSAYERPAPPPAARAPEATQRPAGILVAVEADDHVSQALVENVLRQHGARAIERAARPGFSRADCRPVPLSFLLAQSEPDPAPAARTDSRH